MAYKISGRVLYIGPSQSISSKSGASHVKRDLIISVRRFDPNTGQPTDDPRNTPIFQFFNDKCQQLDRIKIGDIVIVDFSIFGRTYEKEGRREYITDVSPNSVYPDRTQNLQQPTAVPSQPIQQQTAQQTPHAYPQPPQQAQPAQQYTSPPYGQNAVTQPQNGRQWINDDPPF